MKNLSLALNVVLLIAVGVLYFLHFSSGSAEVQEEPASDTSGSDYTIAYIDPDSVLTNYEYFIELQNQLKAKSEKLQSDYQNRAQSLQNEVNDYQRTLSNLTIGQAKALEENLVKKEQNLRLYQESLTQELLKDKSKNDQQIYDRITDFLKTYGKDNNLQLVVQFNQGSDVLFATEGMDITQVVTDGLNELYTQEKEGVEVKPVTTETDSTQTN